MLHCYHNSHVTLLIRFISPVQNSTVRFSTGETLKEVDSRDDFPPRID